MLQHLQPTWFASSVMLGVAENVGEQWLKQNQTTGLYNVFMLSFFFVALVFLGRLGEDLPFIFASLTLSRSLTPADTHKNSMIPSNTCPGEGGQSARTGPHYFSLVKLPSTTSSMRR